MIKRIHTTALFSLVLSSLAFAETTPAPPIQGTMASLATTLQDLLPSLFNSEQDFKDKQALKSKVDSLVTAFEGAKPHLDQRAIPFKISYNVMLGHLKETQRLVETNQIPKAVQKLKAVPSLCVSCHTQDSEQQKFFIGLNRSHFHSDFQFAEFSYATRDYGTAITYFDKYLTNPGAYRSEANTKTALERLLTVYVQVDREPNMAAVYLEEYVPFIIDFPNIKTNLITWVKDLKTLSQEQQDIMSGKKTLNFETLTEMAQDLEQSSAQDQPNSKIIDSIILRGNIYTYLNSKPGNDEVPKLLYWLALADKKLGYQFYYSFADMYLKECVQSYGSDPYAQKCKKELENYRQTT